MIAILIGVVLGAVLSLPALFVAVVGAGGGHGPYIEARALFPVPMLLTLIEGHIGPAAMTVGLLQFPAYGGLAGWAIVRRKQLPLVITLLVHVAAAIACFSGVLPNFS